MNNRWIMIRRLIATKRFTAFCFAIMLALLHSASVRGQGIPDRISFRNILENKDVSLGEGSSIFQDSRGFIWLGSSNELVRYDGYEFRSMEYVETIIPESNTDSAASRPNPKSAEYFPIKGVQHFYEDTDKNLWMASRSGLFRYQPKINLLTEAPNDPSQSINITSSHFRKIIPLPDGKLLLCASYGFFILDPTTMKYIVYEPNPADSNALNGERVHTGLLDPAGFVWLGTDSGLEKFDVQTKQFTLYPLDKDQPHLMSVNRVFDMVRDIDGRLWLATAKGLVNVDPETMNLTRYVNNPKDPFSLGGDDVWSLLLDSSGLLWVGSNGGGLSLYDRENNRFIRHRNEVSRSDSLSTNQIRALYEDQSGDIWVGLFPIGFNYFERSSSAITSYSEEYEGGRGLSAKYVRSVLEDELGNLWLGTDGGGLNYFDRQSGKFIYYRHDADEPTSIPGDAVLATYKDSKGVIWAGFWGAGLASFHPSDMRFTHFPRTSATLASKRIESSYALNSEYVWSIREDKHGDMWIATYDGGLNQYNPTTKKFTHFRYLPDDPSSIASDVVWFTFEDHQNNFWVGTSRGLSLMDREKGTFTTLRPARRNSQGPSSTMVISMLEDSQQRLWLGTEVGLQLLNTNTKQFTLYDRESGFIDETIRAIVEDSEGNLWVSTNNGFSKFDPRTKEIKNYNRISGRLVGGFGMRSAALSRRGEVIFGGINGLRIINPLELIENKKVPPIVITDFRVLSDSVEIGGADGLLQYAIDYTDTIELPHDKSTFAISFAALNYRDPEKNLYSYKLEGFDSEWVDSNDQRVARYTNLDPGEYVFRVKGSNNDGVWNDTGKSLTIIQRPAPWQTWWAYTLYSLVFLGVLYAFIHQQFRRRQLIEEQNRQLEIKVLERTAEVTARTAEVLEKSKNIQVMLSNIPQGLFTVMNDGLIHNEYSEYLESIFETKHIAGLNVCDFLFSQSNLDQETLSLTKSAISSIIGEDEINFEFNQGLLVVDYEIRVGENLKALSLDWNPIVDDGIVDRLMVSVRDVTQIKYMESNLIHSEKLAALGALVAGIAHELNTPIGNGLTVATTLCESCDNMAEKMRSGLTKSALEQFVKDMSEGSNLVNRNLIRASELVSSFKQVAVDRTSAKRRKFSLQEIINEICLTASPIFKCTPFVVEIDIPEDTVLDSYPGPLGQVITNLLNNTVIHAFHGRDHGRVRVASENVIGGVNIIVEDDGVGIPEEFHDKIFDPFFTTKLGSGGNGLGMNIVHNIVTGVLGGTIHLRSHEGEGTCFTLYLPRVAPIAGASPDDEIYA